MIANTTTNQGLTKKLIIGFITLAVTAAISVAAQAAAAPAGKPTKAECEAAGFKNYGQCVKEWAHDKNHNGGGYGGDQDNG